MITQNSLVRTILLSTNKPIVFNKVKELPFCLLKTLTKILAKITGPIIIFSSVIYQSPKKLMLLENSGATKPNKNPRPKHTNVTMLKINLLFSRNLS